MGDPEPVSGQANMLAVLVNATARGAEMASTMYRLIGKITAQLGKRAAGTGVTSTGVV